VVVVRGVRPNGHARNRGVAQTRSPLLVFLDDDAMPGHPELFERLLEPLRDPLVGVAGSAKLLPPNASAFQRRVDHEVPRITHPVVQTTLETNPDPPLFYCDITTTCCAMRREVFAQIGGFGERVEGGGGNEGFLRGGGGVGPLPPGAGHPGRGGK
ncbi:MAG TPA: glycosyltransferase, partial [Roseiflexaceae bacterium]|nr:glycosyltransferase [Roseiflexaceae bacterium]